MKTINEFIDQVNSKVNTNVQVFSDTGFDETGHFAGTLVGSSPEELYEFLRYIASARGRDFDRVGIRYGTPNPPTFTCYVEFDRDDIERSSSPSSSSEGGCLASIVAFIFVPIAIYALSGQL